MRFKAALLTLCAALAVSCAAKLVAAGESNENFIPTFAVKYGGTAGWPELVQAARYDLLVIGAGTAREHGHPTIPGNTWQVLKTLNPRLKMLLYEIGPGEYNTASWGQVGQGWGWIKANHGPGSADRWTAVGLNSGDCLQGKAYGNERLMVAGNAGWQQYWLENVYAKSWGNPSKAAAIADGIFSDNTLYAMPYLGGWYQEGHPDKPDVPADYYAGGVYNAAVYHQQMKSFFARAFPWLAARNVKIALNFGDMVRRPENWMELDGEPNPPLAAMDEGAFVHPWGGQGSFVFWREEEWLHQINVMRNLKHVRALMNVHGPVAGDLKGFDRMNGRDAAGNRAWDVLWYSMASFLQGLNKERSNASMNLTVWGYTEFYWFKEFDPNYVDLGKARGESRRVNGRQGHIYLREFEKGWAAVNPTSEPAAGVAVPLGQAQLVDHDSLDEAEAQPLVQEFNLPAHRGVVLLKDGYSLGNKSNAYQPGSLAR
jgi:hypothetical protein